jgi:hypothetical protein
VKAPDPDRGRDRATAALGRRDWGWFAAGPGRPGRDPGRPVWGTTRHVTAHDRFDRTLGIPERDTPMWHVVAPPLELAGTTPPRRAELICDTLVAGSPSWAWPAPATCVALLVDAAPSLPGRDPALQAAALAAAARRHHVDPATARALAVGVGSLLAQTTHRAAPTEPGAASLNLLCGARLDSATALFLARQRARHDQRLSDPDLPRLWILANGLAHGVPAAVLRREPARSVGPAARLVPVHEDLVGWDGIGAAVTHLRDVVRAAVAGQRWLAQHPPHGGDELALAVGVVALTRPTAAAQLARAGPARLDPDAVRAATGAPPSGVLELSDEALKGVCDRNGWLLGSPSERTIRELAERGRPGPGADAALDATAYRHNPPAPDVIAAQRLVGEAGREALRLFAGVDPPQRPTLTDALAHRFPARATRDQLRSPEPAQLRPTPPGAAGASRPVAQVLDLGL